MPFDPNEARDREGKWTESDPFSAPSSNKAPGKMTDLQLAREMHRMEMSNDRSVQPKRYSKLVEERDRRFAKREAVRLADGPVATMFSGTVNLREARRAREATSVQVRRTTR